MDRFKAEPDRLPGCLPAEAQACRSVKKEDTMYDRILVPLDGSELAERTIPYVAELSQRLGSEAILFTVFTAHEHLERPLKAYLEKKAQELTSLGVKARIVVSQGNAAAEILTFAEKNEVGLIALSSHGRTGVKLWTMGSVTHKVLQRSHSPVLLVRSDVPQTETGAGKLEKILVLLDGSEFSESTLPFIERIAGCRETEVYLLRVIEPVATPHLAVHAGGFDWEKYEKDLAAHLEKETKHYLQRKENSLRGKAVTVTSIVLAGKPTHVILEYAEDKAFDLIALSTHGLSGITKWVYGSVAAGIIERSSNHIFLVRNKSSDGDS